MAEELSIDSLKEMKKADFIKAFKNKAAWKKAKAVIVMVDYKLDGKKTTIAIPFKKEAEMKSEMKRMKKEKTHPLKKSGGGMISFAKDGEEGMKAKIELTLGGLKPELLQAKGEDLFGRINTTLEVLIAANAELESDEELNSDAEETADSEGLDLPIGSDAADTDDDAADTDDDAADTDDDDGLITDLESRIKGVNSLMKEKVVMIVAAINAKEPKEEFFDIIEGIIEKIKDIKADFSGASDKVKTTLGDKIAKVLERLAPVEKIRTTLASFFKKGETPSELPPAVKKFIDDLVAKIKEAKAIKADPKKFGTLVKVIQTVFDGLTFALKALGKELVDKIIASKTYQFIEDFIESLGDEVEEDDEEDDDENGGGGEQPEKVTEEEKKEFDGTVKELETLFSAVGIQL